jgi:hypothetical protein
MPVFTRRTAATAGGRSDPLVAVIWITIAMALFGGLAVFARAAMNAGLHPFVVVFLRNVFAVAMLLPLLAWRGPSLLHSPQIGLYAVRVGISRSPCWRGSTALSLIPIGEVTASASWRRCLGRWGDLPPGREGAGSALGGADRGLCRGDDHPAAGGELGSARSAPSCLPWPRASPRCSSSSSPPRTIPTRSCS